LSKIKFDPRNYRKHGEKNKSLINSSLKEYGAGRSILIDNEDVIVAGNGVYEEAANLGLKVRVIESDGTELIAIKRTDLATNDERRKLLAIADNKTSDTSEFDFQLLSEDFNMEILEGLGFDDFEIDLFKEEVNIEDDNCDLELPQEPNTKISDIYQLGNHRLMCGDSSKEEDLKSLMGDELADAWVTDPPYNVDYKGKTKDSLTIANDNMGDTDFRAFLVACYAAADSVMKKGAAFYIWHSDTEGYNFRGACRDIGWQLRECLIWVKNSLVMGRQDYHWKHEPCLYGWKGGDSHTWNSDRKQTTVIEWDKPLRNDIHPTMKPVGLIGYQINNSTKKGAIVLDSFAGSGTALIACEEIGRKARLMEFDPKYCDVIVKRYVKYLESKNIAPVVIKNGVDISSEEWLSNK